MGPLQPRQQGRPEVKAQVEIGVDDALRAPVLVHDPRPAIGPIAFGVDAFVPVVKRTGVVLAVDCAGPGIFARWLVEMSVYDERINKSYSGVERLRPSLPPVPAFAS
jgi:hypothetical protein